MFVYIIHQDILQRAAMLALASAVLATAIPPVRPSVRLSHAGIVSKRLSMPMSIVDLYSA